MYQFSPKHASTKRNRVMSSTSMLFVRIASTCNFVMGKQSLLHVTTITSIKYIVVVRKKKTVSQSTLFWWRYFKLSTALNFSILDFFSAAIRNSLLNRNSFISVCPKLEQDPWNRQKICQTRWRKRSEEPTCS